MPCLALRVIISILLAETCARACAQQPMKTHTHTHTHKCGPPHSSPHHTLVSCMLCGPRCVGRARPPTRRGCGVPVELRSCSLLLSTARVSVPPSQYSAVRSSGLDQVSVIVWCRGGLGGQGLWSQCSAPSLNRGAAAVQVSVGT